MIRDRSELEKELDVIINEIKHNRKEFDEVENRLSEKYKVAPGLIADLSMGGKQWNEIEEWMLCLIAEVVSEVTGAIRIAPINFYHQEEIEEAKRLALEPKNSHELLPLTISEVLMISPNEYITKIKMTELVAWFNANLIYYDYETQRSAKWVRTSKAGVVPVPDVNEKHVKEIAEHYLNETYLTDTITLNVYSDEVKPLTYNPRSKQLTINKGAVVSILDGFHRLQAGIRAVSVNPNLSQVMQLAIKSFDTETAKKYFGQINTIHIVKKQRLQELKQERFSDYVVNELKTKSDLQGKIASAAQISTIANQLTTFAILSDAIDENFEMQSRLEAKEVSDYLRNFFDYLVGSFPDQFLYNQDKYRQTSYINNQHMFAGYVVLAKKFQENNIPLKKVQDVINSIDFSKDGVFKDIYGKARSTDAKKIRAKLTEFFKELDVTALATV
jgi:hypothetical protein